jgi:hypothetical protein
LTDLKRAGFAHDSTIKCKDGGLAVFCASCPQPGINVTEDEIRCSDTPYVLLLLCCREVHIDHDTTTDGFITQKSLRMATSSLIMSFLNVLRRMFG